jgi:hypothetical protein
VADAYVRVERGLAADKLDAEAVASLKAAADRVDDPGLADLRTAALGVASAKDIAAARTAMKALSDALVHAADLGPATAPVRGQP